MPDSSLGNIASTLQPDRTEVDQVSREATADSRLFSALHATGILLAGIAGVVNWLEDHRLWSMLLPSFIVALSIYGLVMQTSARRKRILGIVAFAQRSPEISYRLSSAGVEIEGDGASRLRWDEVRTYDETPHAFLLHADRTVPEVLYKRAFAEDELQRVRQYLEANVKKRRVGRTLAITLAMGFGVLALGIVLAVTVGGPRH